MQEKLISVCRLSLIGFMYMFKPIPDARIKNGADGIKHTGIEKSLLSRPLLLLTIKYPIVRKTGIDEDPRQFLS